MRSPARVRTPSRAGTRKGRSCKGLTPLRPTPPSSSVCRTAPAPAVLCSPRPAVKVPLPQLLQGHTSGRRRQWLSSAQPRPNQKGAKSCNAAGDPRSPAAGTRWSCSCPAQGWRGSPRAPSRDPSAGAERKAHRELATNHQDNSPTWQKEGLSTEFEKKQVQEC